MCDHWYPTKTCGQSNPTVRSSWDNVISPDPGGRVSRERTRRLPAPRRSVARVDGMANCVPVSDTLSILAASPFASRRRPRRGSQVKRFLVEEGIGTDREFSAIFDREGGAT